MLLSAPVCRTHNPRTRQMESIIRDTSKFGPVMQVNATFTYNSE